MELPKCNHHNPENAGFCNKCGNNLNEPEKPPGYSEPNSCSPKHLSDKILTPRSTIKYERKLMTHFKNSMAALSHVRDGLETMVETANAEASLVFKRPVLLSRLPILKNYEEEPARILSFSGFTV